MCMYKNNNDSYNNVRNYSGWTIYYSNDNVRDRIEKFDSVRISIS